MNAFLEPGLYVFNPYAVPVMVVGILVLATGIFILKQNRASRANFSFFILCLFIFVWLSGFSLIYSITNPGLAVQIYRHYTFLGVIGIASSIYFFSVVWLDFWEKQKRFVVFGYAASFLFYILAFTTNHVATYTQRFFWGFYPRYGILGAAFFVLFAVYFFAAFFNFAHRLKHPIPNVQKSQIKAVILAFCFAFTGTVDYLPKLTGFGIYPFGYLSVFFWISIIAYAIVKYKMMDIQTVIHKTFLWLATSLTFLAPIAVISYFLHDWFVTLPTGGFAFLVFCFMVAFVPYVRFVQPYIDQWFERRRWNLNQVFKQFTDELIHLKNLEDLANHILQTIRRTLYPEDANLLLWDEGKSECLVFTSEGKVLKVDCQKNENFFSFLGSYGSVMISDLVDIDPRLESVRLEAHHYFRDANAKVCAPIVLDERLIGAINLGQKVNLKEYASAEIRFLSDIRGSAAIAISNSLRLIAMQANLRKWNEELDKQVKERTKQLQDAQAQLIQAEKLATIGTLAGGVAHEINNPLAAILTNAQMLLADNLNLETKESLELIEEAAERCRVIVQKLMKYSRKSPEEELREIVSVNDVIENTISFLKYQFDQENIKIETDLKASAAVHGNANELAQVFTNLILNARDAVLERIGERTIQIRTEENETEISAEVEDNGTGISPEVIPKIFDPFFTTKDVGKGTGLGLSIVHGIVQKHGARIDVKSKVGVGTKISVIFPKNKGQA